MMHEVVLKKIGNSYFSRSKLGQKLNTVCAYLDWRQVIALENDS